MKGGVVTEKTAKWIFWGGTSVSLLLFLALTVDTHRQFAALTHADKLSDQVVSGKRAFEKHNCNDCHTVLGFGAYYAPDLTRAYTRLGEASIQRRLESPEIAFVDSYRKMPHQKLSEQEVKDIVAYLAWISQIENQDWPPQHSEKRWKRSTARMLAAARVSPGAAVIEQEQCLACHNLGATGGNQAIRFEWIAKRRDSRWIADFLEDPEKHAPGCGMPAYPHLSLAQRESVGEFIAALSAPSGR
ncbi:MAG: cytochrome C [Acidobacteria bacterium]|nr:MAG: cytochrome C [Acidobacteriota bacterium]